MAAIYISSIDVYWDSRAIDDGRVRLDLNKSNYDRLIQIMDGGVNINEIMP